MEALAIELTPEELAIILKKREDEAKQIMAEELFAKVQEGIEALDKLGYRVQLPAIGGKYVHLHQPHVSAKRMELHKRYY